VVEEVEKEQPSSIHSDIVSRRDNIPLDSDNNTSNQLSLVAEELVAHISLVPVVGLQALDRSNMDKNSTVGIFPTNQGPTIQHQRQTPNPNHHDRHHDRHHELDLAQKTP
jgi:hypothetical protein